MDPKLEHITALFHKQNSPNGQYCDEKKTEFDFYHLRSCKLKIDDEIISSEVASKSFDHISEERILDLLTEKITDLSA